MRVGVRAGDLEADPAVGPAGRHHVEPDPAASELLDRREPAAEDDLARCAERVVALVSGRYDALSGNYYELDDDLDAALAQSLAGRA